MAQSVAHAVSSQRARARIYVGKVGRETCNHRGMRGGDEGPGWHEAEAALRRACAQRQCQRQRAIGERYNMRLAAKAFGQARFKLAIERAEIGVPARCIDALQ